LHTKVALALRTDVDDMAENKRKKAIEAGRNTPPNLKGA